MCGDADGGWVKIVQAGLHVVCKEKDKNSASCQTEDVLANGDTRVAHKGKEPTEWARC